MTEILFNELNRVQKKIKYDDFIVFGSLHNIMWRKYTHEKWNMISFFSSLDVECKDIFLKLINSIE